MIRWAAGWVRRTLGALLWLLLIVSGAEVAVRLAELRAQRPLTPRHPARFADAVTIPSWVAFRELRPLAAVPCKPWRGASAQLVKINSHGLRGPEAVVPKPVDVYRVLCLGDERLLGPQLPEADVLTSQLARTLQPATQWQVEVWNAGVPGACPLTSGLLVTHRYAVLQPDLIVVLVTDSDLADDQSARRYLRTDPAGRPVACRHPSLARVRKSSLLTDCRNQFRLVDLGLHWAGDAWKQRAEFDDLHNAETESIDPGRLRHDAGGAARTAQPLAVLAEWCRQTNTVMCVAHVRQAPAEGTTGSTALTEALQQQADAHRFLLVELDRPVSTADAPVRKQWSPDEHRQFAGQLSQRLLAEIRGPWNSPYFQTPNVPVTPASHQRNPAAFQFSRGNDSSKPY